MANTFTAPFVQNYKTGAISVTKSSAPTQNDPAQMTLLATAGPNGSLVTRLSAIPKGTVTATALALYAVKAEDKDTAFLVDSELMPAWTYLATSAHPETFFGNISPSSPMRLAPGDKLYVAVRSYTAGSDPAFFCEWGDL